MRYILLACMLLLSFSACRERTIIGHGETRTETRLLRSAAFNIIKIDAPVDARITIGPAPSLTLAGYANVLPYLHSEVRDNILHIFTDERTDLDSREKITATITLPVLAGLDISGTVDAAVTGAIHMPRFTLDLSGAGSVDIRELHVQSFHASLSGATSLSLRDGDIKDGTYSISGTGSISAFGVNQRSASLDLSGAADAEVTVSDKLDVSISGTGAVKYKGHPAITQDISGVGSVSNAN